MQEPTPASEHPASQPPEFIFVTCHHDAAGALKQELGRTHPELRLAYSRPGFLTFKLSGKMVLPLDWKLDSVFARSHGFSLGKVQGDSLEQLAEKFWAEVPMATYQALHVWPRDPVPVGQRQFYPHITPEAQQLAGMILAGAPGTVRGEFTAAVNAKAGRGQLVLDAVLVEPGQCWIGYHKSGDFASRWPGGMMPLEMPEHAVSRAYLKMTEALAWSRLPVRDGDPCVELGSAPGGSSQVLLERGLVVNGIDPAEMDEAVLVHPHFRHVKMRGSDLKRREYRGVRWLFADVNLVPEAMLRSVESIVTYPGVHVRGMILTLKLREWELAEEVPAYLDRIRSWGFREVRARQLATNRQEITVAALRRRALRRKARITGQRRSGGGVGSPRRP